MQDRLYIVIEGGVYIGYIMDYDNYGKRHDMIKSSDVSDILYYGRKNDMKIIKIYEEEGC